jgi:hypothetical protein
MIKRHILNLTTDSSGNASGSTPAINGFLESIRYIKNNFTDGVDFTVTIPGLAAVNLWVESNVNASAQRFPRSAAHDSTGTAITGAWPRFALAGDVVTVAVASGGDTHSGQFEIITSDC